MRVQVQIKLKPGVLDVQGKAVEKGLQGLGFADVAEVRVGKFIEMDVEASSLEEAKSKVEKMCTSLLANTVIEDFSICEL